MSVRRNGILLVDKPAGISSAGVVARVKRALSADRVGHAGTLDPDATGLLIILVNGATRVASYAGDGRKVYSGEIQLGVTTSTDDMSGEVLHTEPCMVDFNSIMQEAQSLCGRSMQVPPKVSAKKLGGKRAYDLFRRGQEFELQPREVEVHRFDIFLTEHPDQVRYITEVSPGTYVRSLARDLGERLTCGAAVRTIRRESSGYFAVDGALALEDVSWGALRDWAELVPMMPKVAFSNETISGLLNGQQRALCQAWDECTLTEFQCDYVVYTRQESADSLGILRVVSEGGFAFEINVGSN